MAKIKSSFVCQTCGAQSGKWIGKCTSCGEWNTYVEELIQPIGTITRAWEKLSDKKTKSAKPHLLTDISIAEEPRMQLPDKELSRVLGGGIVKGSITLLGGEPGIGKSTLLLQLAVQLNNARVLYISGEESEQQIRMRAERIGFKNPDCYILTETETSNIFNQISGLDPEIVIIDSVQTLHSDLIESSPGSISQIRECAAEFLRYAKETGIPVFLIGHITKDGTLAGPKVLEHMVDTVLQFEGDRHHVYRILRTLKNRFGSTAELGIYEMDGTGLKGVENPSEALISQKELSLSGSAIACTMEGLRPMLIEAQALVSSAVYGTPQRSSTGLDLRRLNMLLAVLEKRCGFKLGTKDVFLNITGGIRVEDPAIDLGVICAVLSSSEDISINHQFCFAGEVGLSGEIRPVNRIEQRIKEAEKLGFEKIFCSKHKIKFLDNKNYSGIEIIPVNRVEEVFTLLFG
jgi:DNA repair protein RadA/Sms